MHVLEKPGKDLPDLHDSLRWGLEHSGFVNTLLLNCDDAIACLVDRKGKVEDDAAPTIDLWHNCHR